MTKFFTFIILSFLPFLSIAQIGKGNFLIGGTLGLDYTKEPTSSHEKKMIWSVAPKVGYFIAPNIAVGVIGGYEQTSYKNSDPIEYNYFGLSYPYMNDFSNSLTKEQSYSGGVFTEYYLPLHSNLYFTANLSVTLGKQILEYNYYQMDIDLVSHNDTIYIPKVDNGDGVDVGYNVNQSYNFEIKTIARTISLFQANLSPGLVYFITDKIGLSLRMQGFKFLSSKQTTSTTSSYTFYNMPNSKERATNFSFSATNFSVGVQFNL